MIPHYFGFVFAEYKDFDDKSQTGVQIIFSNGALDGFSFDEQKRYLQCLDIDERYSNYKFESILKVWNDWKSGYWKFYEK